MRRSFLISFLVPAAIALMAAGAVSPRYAVVNGSHFWIDGTSTLGRYTCEGAGIAGTASIPENESEVSAELTVPVEGFDCGKSRMNRDFYNALKGDDYPIITFSVHDAEVLEESASPEAWVRVRATGTLRLAGVERPLALTAEGRRLRSGRVQVRGQHALRMTDFGVDPPSGLMGLVRAHDGVVARFDLVAAPR